uniref:Putative isoaspartyl peptidase/L-asparaginase 2 n=1 Tax=Aegilops tauschii TaxID=37682 RepID=M8AU19_AEGTA
MARWAIAIHGGAGVDPNLPEHRQEEAERVLARCLQVGVDMLRSGATALDVVEAVGLEVVDNSYFMTEENVGMLKLAKESNSILFDYRIPLAEAAAFYLQIVTF